MSLFSLFAIGTLIDLLVNRVVNYQRIDKMSYGHIISAKEVIFVWSVGLFFGQLIKEWLKWPRPKSPPVVYMESLYLSEFGMPSTHAIVGICIPFSFLFFSHQRYEVIQSLNFLQSSLIFVPYAVFSTLFHCFSP